MAITVVHSRIYSNPYQQLLFRAINDRYKMKAATIKYALNLARAGSASIYHIHWEEAIFAKCTSGQQATDIRREYIQLLKRYSACGGRIVWTVHNATPHEGGFVRSFHELRKSLATIADKILVHNAATKELLINQTGVAYTSKIQILPHPAYFDVYEPEASTRELAGQPAKYPRKLIHFGLIREYKNAPKLLEMLSPSFMKDNGLGLHIWGKPLLNPSRLDDLVEACRNRAEVELRLSQVPDDEVAHVLRSYAGIVIPYSHVVSSGVAILALTFGVPVIAPRTPAMLELFPESVHKLLFDPSSEDDMRKKVRIVMNLSTSERTQLAVDCLDRAEVQHPDKVSKMLGSLYDELLMHSR